MSGFLLDTNIISEPVKPQPNPKVLAWLEGSDELLFHLSVLTLGEIRKGIDSLAASSRRTGLEAWLSHDLLVRFAGRILDVDQKVADRWGRMSGRARIENRSIPAVDGLLAATALHHNLTLVTRNAKDVAPTGVSVFNPWES
jgi:hypothetical protein